MNFPNDTIDPEYLLKSDTDTDLRSNYKCISLIEEEIDIIEVRKNDMERYYNKFNNYIHILLVLFFVFFIFSFE